MASKRKRGEVWEYTFKRAGVLDKPLYLTFRSESEGDDYAKKLESLLDRGIVPTEYQTTIRITTIASLVDLYVRDAHVKPKDVLVLRSVCETVGKTPVLSVDAAWVDSWITDMKRVNSLAPSTIRSKIGALARCTDWGVRKKLILLPDHPLRTLPQGYSQYTTLDAALSGKKRVDVERDRRLQSGEYEAILTVIDAGVLPRTQRPLVLEHKNALRCMFVLAVESAMRMREIYTLSTDQIDLQKKTIFLDKTKNGDKRQVPMSSIALATLRDFLHGIQNGLIFPWWDGDPTSLCAVSDHLSNLYTSIFEVAGSKGLHFHDLRHEAVSRLFERTTLSDSQIMKISGHKSHKMMMRYANLRGSDLSALMW